MTPKFFIFQFWHFPPILVLFKVTCLVPLIDHKHQFFSKTRQINHFWHFLNELLFTQNVNEARFARNVECDFWSYFHTMCGATIF